MRRICCSKCDERTSVIREGYLDSLPPTEPFDAATCLLVSQFLLEKQDRSNFFRTIAQRLKPNANQSLIDVWFRTIAGADVSPEGLARMRAAYGRDVAVLPAKEIEAIIASGGFDSPIQFFQAGLIHAWYSMRAAHISGT